MWAMAESNLPYTENALTRFRRKLKVIKQCNAERDLNPSYALEVPYEIGLKLTNRCNLRCTHCFQWNENGYHNHLSETAVAKSGDLNIEVIHELLEKTKKAKSSLYLWGGEPFMYTHWDELINLLTKDPRNTVICTNGLFIKQKISTLLPISEHIEILISIEGLEEEHDRLRGKNSFKRIIEAINMLLALKEQGVYKGTISIAGVFNDGLIPHVFEFCSFFEAMGIDALFINFPWYIPHAQAMEMDKYFSDNFSWMQTDRKELNTWHSFKYHISPESLKQLHKGLDKIKERKWNTKIRIQPNLRKDEIDNYVLGFPFVPQVRKRCLGISNRIDVLPSGKVTPCKKFTEFIVGDLNEQSLEEAWHGADFDRFRKIHNNTLHPLCAKCELLYSNGI
jgi:radical SAM protein with 4Fe4S-binding SPASM domain